MQSLAAAVQASVGGQSGAGTGANLSALMRMARNGVTMSGDGQGGSMGMTGSGGSGRGQSPGAGAGGGAGMGSTNSDGGYSEGLSESGQQLGSGGFADRIGAYERIYDPTRLGDGGEVSHVQGEEHEGENQQIQLGAGMGDLNGTVPYNQVVGEYSEAAAQAMRRSALPASLQDWVQRYFNALID